MEPQNEVSLKPEGYIEENWRGPQTSETVEDLTTKSHELAQQLKFEGKEAKVLIDTTQVAEVDSGARSTALQAFKSSGFEKMAIVVDNSILNMLIKVSLKVTNRTNSSKIFKSKDEALQWLLQ